MTRCAWSADRLPHTAHGDCEGFRPELAEGLQRLMDHRALKGVRPMTTDTLTLTDFLLARIAEDEAVATPTWPTDVGNEPLWDAPLRVVTNDPDSSRTEFHLAINTARVLAECEAKRRLLRHVASNWRLEEYVAGILAAVYASHPDYREEWVAPNLSHGEAD